MSDDESYYQKINVIARAPFEVYFEGPAKSISAINKVGPFDILPGHADFFSILEPCDVIVETKDKSITFYASNGIITVKNNNVMLFANM